MKITIDPDDLRPLIKEVVVQVVAQMQGQAASLPDRVYSEAEAARYLSLNPHQLRDERRRGRIEASKIVGGRIRYSRQQLLDYLQGRGTTKVEG